MTRAEERAGTNYPALNGGVWDASLSARDRVC